MQPQTKLILIGESFSPWSKKARWALEQCGLVYSYREYTPTLSEPGLRWRLRQWTGSVSVPVLLANNRIFRGSWEIARYANEMSGDQRLGDMSVVKPWDDLSEDALAEGRTRVVRCILNNDQALEEALPAPIPRLLRRPMRFLSRDAAKRLDRKYAHLVKPGAIRRALERTQKELANASSDYLMGRFSYADITMAVVLEVIAPIAVTQPPLGPATQACWNDPNMADDFQDLLAWRNHLAGAQSTSFSQFQSRDSP